MELSIEGFSTDRDTLNQDAEKKNVFSGLAKTEGHPMENKPNVVYKKAQWAWNLAQWHHGYVKSTRS